MLHSLSKTNDFTNTHKFINKTHYFIKILDLLNKIDDFIKDNKFA